MGNADAAQLIDEILQALQSVGEPEDWVRQRVDGSEDCGGFTAGTVRQAS